MKIVVGFFVIGLHFSQSLTPNWNHRSGNVGDNNEVPKIQIQSQTRVDNTDNDNDNNNNNILLLRGGGSTNNVVKGTKATLSMTVDYWKHAFKSLKEKVKEPFASMKIPRFLKSKQDQQTDDLLQELQTTLVLNVHVPNTTVLPQDVIQLAAKRAGLLGRPLKTDSVQEFARALKQWYERKGYVLHSVTGATLHADTNTAEIQVEEPYLNHKPVDIIYCKEMVVDLDGSLLSFRQYKDKHSRRDTLGLHDLKKKDLNTTFITTIGKTSPTRIAKALQLRPKTTFQWQSHRWQAILAHGIFSKVLRATPERMPDGTVQLQILAIEAPPRNLEYGLSKSLYTGSWEGEVDFQHSNILGGGESLGVTVKRGTKDAEPSVRLKFSNDKFGLEGGYDIEVFSDYIGEHLDDGNDDDDGKRESKDFDHDELLDRKGATVRLRNPINPKTIRNSRASACLERTSTRSGQHEAVGSVTLGLGPFRKELPLNARSDVLGSLTTGTRIIGEKSSNFNILPYSILSATTRQIFPLTSEGSRPLTLALQHTATTSTSHLPRHEGNAFGIASKIRGCSPSGNDRVSSFIIGTTELRIPITLPTDKFRQDASIVVFGDWSLTQKDLQSSFDRKSSVGIGLRKGLQGIPIKYDLSYTQGGKFRAFFGLGRDFDV